MNQEQNWRRAERLFDAIGQIEDRYIAEADTVYQPAPARLSLRRWIVLATSLSLAVCLMSGLFIANLLGGRKSSENYENLADRDGMEEDLGTLSTLDTRLEEIKPRTEGARIEADAIDLFDGKARVVWQYADEEGYRAHDLTPSQLSELTALSHMQGDQVSADEGEDTVRIWIAMGDGTVITPCLAQADGNVGYGSLFLYQSEREPSQNFSDRLCEILTES